MKKFPLLIILLACTPMIMAQNGNLFTYDQTKLFVAMDQINEASVLTKPFSPDTSSLIKSGKASHLVSYGCGLSSAIVMGVIGVFLFEPVTWNENCLLLTGMGIAGLIIPPLAMGLSYKDNNAGWAVIGTLTGCLVDLGFIAIWYIKNINY